MINPQLKKALLDRLGITESALSRRAQKKKLEIPMSTEDAAHLIAHQAGLRIDQYLMPEQVAHIRSLHIASSGTAPAAGKPEQKRTSSSNGPRELRFPGEFKVANPLLDATKLGEAHAMARIYPVLYVLENSIRELIKRVIRARHGDDWWNTRLTSGKLKKVHQTAAGRMQSEKKNTWHQKRGAHPIDYVDLAELRDIICGHQDCFVPNIFPDLPWFEHFMKELYPSRNVVCHMNPLTDDNVKDVQLKLKKWENVVKSAESAIPV